MRRTISSARKYRCGARHDQRAHTEEKRWQRWRNMQTRHASGAQAAGRPAQTPSRAQRVQRRSQPWRRSTEVATGHAGRTPILSTHSRNRYARFPQNRRVQAQHTVRVKASGVIHATTRTHEANTEGRKLRMSAQNTRGVTREPTVTANIYVPRRKCR